MATTSTKLTNIQLELLKMFRYNLAESQLIELKEILSKYFMDKVDSETEKLWIEKKWSDSTMESLANQHARTPYKK
jgi:hypothetical protein